MADASNDPATRDGVKAAGQAKPPSSFWRPAWFQDVIGPLTRTQLLHVVQTGQVSGACGVSRTADGPWRPVSDVPQLVALLPTPTEPSDAPPIVATAVLDPPNDRTRLAMINQQAVRSNSRSSVRQSVWCKRDGKLPNEFTSRVANA